MQRLSRATLIAVLALAPACFERGGGKPKATAGKDGGVTPALDAGAAGPGPDEGGWLARAVTGPGDPAATVTLALEAEPVSLDPFAAVDAAAARVLGDVYEGLLCERPGGEPAACLAERWEVSPDGKVWRFWLRKGVLFHDGKAVTGADVIASFKAPGQGAAATGPLAAVLDDLLLVTTPKPGEVVVTFGGARATRLHDLTRIPIAPAARLKAGDLGKQVVGTGPLRFTAWNRGASIELARWEKYWGPPAGAAVVRHRIVADRAEALRLLAAGEVDVVLQVPLADAVAATTGGVVRFRYEQPAVLVAVYNARRPALGSAGVRQALTALLDREGVARAVLGGARVATGPWPPGTREADPQVSPVPFDRTLAGRLLGNARPTVQVLVPQGSTSTARIADIWAADARGLVTLQVETVPYGDLLARLSSGEFDVAITSMSAGPDVDLWSRMSSQAPASEAWCGLKDPELDGLLEAMRTELDPAKRPRDARAVHRRIADLQPMAFIAVDTRAGLARPGVGGMVAPPEHGGAPTGRDLWKRTK